MDNLLKYSKIQLYLQYFSKLIIIIAIISASILILIFKNILNGANCTLEYWLLYGFLLYVSLAIGIYTLSNIILFYLIEIFNKNKKYILSFIILIVSIVAKILFLVFVSIDCFNLFPCLNISLYIFNLILFYYDYILLCQLIKNIKQNKNNPNINQDCLKDNVILKNSISSDENYI